MSETSKCNRCGATLPPDAPEGLCPRCLIAANLATQTDVTGESVSAKLPPLPVSDVSKLFPQLEILECLGRGGMGAVYKARQPRLDRLVALKILSPEKQGNQKFAERFEREARALAKLHHPNIVTVYDFGEVQGNFYLLMEFVDGLTLRQLLQSRQLSPPEALAIVPKICEALQYAHGQGIVHRDIKPENILMDKEGHVKIADFGIAKILGDGTRGNLTEAQAIGTPHYMSPEQIEKPQTVDHRADIYSLGVVFYEMLTGELPLGRFQPPSKKFHVDVRLHEIVLRALEKEPERRYQQAGEIKTHVETVAATAGANRAGMAQTERPEISGLASPSKKSGLVRIVEIFFDITFKSRFAIILLNLSALGFLGCLGFLGFLPGMRFCFGFFGFTGFFGLIGVAFLVEFVSGTRPATISKFLLPLVAMAVIAAFAVLALYLQNHYSAPPASAEIWEPTLAPGEKPDLQKILDSAGTLMDQALYEESLQHYVWYFNHSRNSDSYQQTVRLAVALPRWIELGRRYPKARQALVEIRDTDTLQFLQKLGPIDLFREIVSLNGSLGDDDATVSLLNTIEKRDPQLADECFLWAKDTLFQNGDYETCRKYMGDPQAAFNLIHQMWQSEKHFEQQQAKFREQQNKYYEAMAKTNPMFAHFSEPPPSLPSADKTFVGQTRQWIKILVATGSKSDAENIQAKALAVLNDPGLESAVADAEGTVAGQGSVEDADKILAGQPPVVVETFPVSGAQDVDFGEAQIRVRFSKDMMDDSWSWSSAWENSKPASIGDPQYDDAHRTCSLKVKLEPGHTYAFWLNSDKFHNFMDADGRRAIPYLLIFHTKASQGSQTNATPNPPPALTNTNHPYVVSVWPQDGATNVDTRQEMRIRFSHGMSPTDFGVMWYSGGYLTNGQIHYDPDHDEFTFPMQLLPGSANKLRVGGWGEGFRDTNGNPADEFTWQFTTKPFVGRADAPKPHIVQISPDDGQTLPVLTFFQLTFDQPMTLNDGLPYLRKNGMGMDPPSLISNCAYDPAARRFTIPIVLPPDNETKLVLEGFRSADGAAADPVAIPCEIGTNNYSANQLSDIAAAAQDPRLVQLLTSIKSARAGYTSGIETVQWIMASQEKSALSWLSGDSALFKWQGTNQFYEDISGIMNQKTFILGTDGKTCWLYSNSKDYPSYLNNTPVASVAKINVCIADPFDLMWRTVNSAIASGKLIYEGQSQLNGRACYRIESWSVKQTGDDNFPVEANKYEWWIDAETFLPLQIVVSGQKWTFRYESLNQPLPASAFQPPIEPGSSPQPEDWYAKKLERGETRFLTIKDGSDGGMSGRMGRRGPNGTTSSGLN